MKREAGASPAQPRYCKSDAAHAAHGSAIDATVQKDGKAVELGQARRPAGNDQSSLRGRGKLVDS